MIDRAIWAAWYDVAPVDRERYLAWLHGTYIPGVLKHPGYLWAAHYATLKKEAQPNAMHREKTLTNVRDTQVPTGEDYILIFGAADTAVFGACPPSEINATLPASGKAMLALRKNERINIMTEAARVDGPELASYPAGMQLAPCIQMGQFNCTPEYEEEMMTWYARWRMPAVSRTPGSVRTRKLSSVAGWARHAILYEFTSLAARNEHFTRHEDGHPDMIAWGDRMVAQLTHAPGSSNLAVRVWPPL